MTNEMSNHALQLTRPSRSGCNAPFRRAGELGLGRSACLAGGTAARQQQE